MNIKQKIIYIYFLILPFIDLVTSLITRFTNFPISLGVIIKGLTLVLVLVYTLFFSNSRYRTKTIKYYLLVLVFGVIYLLLKLDSFSVSFLVTEITNAFKYLYFPLMLLGLLNVFDDFKIDNKLIEKVLLINCLTYMVLLLVPFFLNSSFDSYQDGSAFGKSGWFYAANEIGAIVVLLLFSVKKLLEEKKLWKSLLILPTFFAIAIIGTKVSYVGMIIVSGLIIVELLYKHKWNGVFPALVLFVYLLITISFSPAMRNLSSTVDRIESSDKNEIVITKKDKNKDKDKDSDEEEEKVIVIDEKLYRTLEIVFNGRATSFIKNIVVFYNDGVESMLFGLGWEDRVELIEIDYLDILISYGMVGFVIYFLPLLGYLYYLLRNRHNWDIEIVSYTLLMLLGIAISSFAGHVLSAPAVSIYLILLIIIVQNKLNSKLKLKEKEITVMALHLNYGGIEKYIASLTNMLGSNYHFNIIVTYKMHEEPAFKFSKNVKITYLIDDKPNREEFLTYLKERRLFKAFKAGLHSLKILYLKRHRNIVAIKKIRSKYIITTRAFHNTLVGSYAGPNIITIASEHNYHNNDQKYIKKVITSLRGINYFVLVSESLYNFYAPRIKNTTCVYIPNVIDNLPKKASTLKENVLVNIGRCEKEKNQKDLIEIIKKVKREVKDVKLYIIGDGSLYSNLEQKIKGEGLEKNIILTGFLNPKEIEKYLLQAKAFVLTSLSESFGLVLLEAMSYKVPCLAYSCADGAKELLKDDVGILVNGQDKEEMAREIISLLTDSKKCSQYAQKSYQKCQEYLSSNIKNKWLKLLK